jgi:hypothetical protein
LTLIGLNGDESELKEYSEPTPWRASTDPYGRPYYIILPKKVEYFTVDLDNFIIKPAVYRYKWHVSYFRCADLIDAVKSGAAKITAIVGLIQGEIDLRTFYRP